MTFQVTVAGTNAPVQEGETFEVTVSVDNAGSTAGTQALTLTVGGVQRDAQSVDLAAGAGTTIMLTWTTGVGDAGFYEFSVASDDTVDTGDVDVTEPPTTPVFDVDIDGTNSPVTVGNSFDVQVLVENTGGEPGTRTVTLTVGGTERDSANASLENGQSKTVALTWPTEKGDAGTYRAVVSSADDSDSTDVGVVGGSVGTPEIPLDVSIDWTNGPIIEGQSLCIDCTATNTGDTAGIGTVEASVGDLAGDSKKKKKVALDAGESGTVHFTVEQDSYREGNEAEYERNIRAETGTDSAETTTSISKPPHLAVDIQSTNGPVNEGDKIKTTAMVENTGGETGHETVALMAKEYVNSISNAGSVASPDRHGPIKTGRFPVDTTGVELGPGESTQVTLELQTVPGDAGEHAISVGSTDNVGIEGYGWQYADQSVDTGGRRRDGRRGREPLASCLEGSRTDSDVVAVDRHGPLKTGRFEVSIDDVEVPGWQDVTIPGVSVEEGSYVEGEGYDEESWGRPTFDDLEMERGVQPGDTQLYDWHQAVRNGNTEEGYKDVVIELVDDQGETRIQWKLFDCWPKEYTPARIKDYDSGGNKDYDPPELDPSADGDIATEEITIAYDQMERQEI